MSSGFITIDEKAEATPAAMPRCSRSDWMLSAVQSGCSRLHVLICAIRCQAGYAARRPPDRLPRLVSRSPGCAAGELPTSWLRRPHEGLGGMVDGAHFFQCATQRVRQELYPASRLTSGSSHLGINKRIHADRSKGG